MTDTWDIAIIGAGAAGLAAGIFAAEAARGAARIALLDGARSIGAKILVAGGGRCNVTHDHIRIDDYNGSRNIVRNVLRAFDENAAVRWFESMGVRLNTEETGKLFPVTDSAKTVLNALLRRCEELGVKVMSEHRVLDVQRATDQAGAGFVVRHQHGELRGRHVVLATGGRSLPRTGSDGYGWQIARRLGHSVTETYPALVPLVLDDSFFHAQLSGLSQGGELSTFSDGKLIDRRTGSLLWTHFGISGPVVMDASRHWVIAHAQGRQAEMRVCLLPGRSFEQVEQWLVEAAQRKPRASAASILREIPSPEGPGLDRGQPDGERAIPARAAEAICRHCGIGSDLPIGQLPKDQRRRLVHALTGLVLPVLRDRGWNYAEVTAGGVPLEEIDYRTMESRRMPGLYLIGEILDCDGRIGGFNFQWAWATGHVAGKAAGARATQLR